MRRLDYIDKAKGIGIILMIIGHLKIGILPYTAIYSFHMPMFFLISGYLYTTPNKNKYFSRTKKILIPYIIFSILYLLIYFAARGIDWNVALSLIWNNSDSFPIESALWFLTALFTCQSTYTLLDLKIKDKRKLLLTCITISIATSLITNAMGILLPFSIQAGIVALSYYSIGQYLKTRKIIQNISTKYTLALGATTLLFVTISLFLPLHNIRLGQYGAVPLSLIIAINASVFIIAASKIKKIKPIDAVLSFIGKNSIVYLLFNHITIIATSAILSYLNLPKALMVIFQISIVIISISALALAREKIKNILNRSIDK